MAKVKTDDDEAFAMCRAIVRSSPAVSELGYKARSLSKFRLSILSTTMNRHLAVGLYMFTLFYIFPAELVTILELDELCRSRRT